MSQSQPSTIERLYLAAESLRHVALTLPEPSGGLSHLLTILSEDVQATARLLDDGEPPTKKQ